MARYEFVDEPSKKGDFRWAMKTVVVSAVVAAVVLAVTATSQNKDTAAGALATRLSTTPTGDSSANGMLSKCLQICGEDEKANGVKSSNGGCCRSGCGDLVASGNAQECTKTCSSLCMKCFVGPAVQSTCKRDCNDLCVDKRAARSGGPSFENDDGLRAEPANCVDRLRKVTVSKKMSVASKIDALPWHSTVVLGYTDASGASKLVTGVAPHDIMSVDTNIEKLGRDPHKTIHLGEKSMFLYGDNTVVIVDAPCAVSAVYFAKPDGSPHDEVAGVVSKHKEAATDGCCTETVHCICKKGNDHCTKYNIGGIANGRATARCYANCVAHHNQIRWGTGYTRRCGCGNCPRGC